MHSSSSTKYNPWKSDCSKSSAVGGNPELLKYSTATRKLEDISTVKIMEFAIPNYVQPLPSQENSISRHTISFIGFLCLPVSIIIVFCVPGRVILLVTYSAEIVFLKRHNLHKQSKSKDVQHGSWLWCVRPPRSRNSQGNSQKLFPRHSWIPAEEGTFPTAQSQKWVFPFP